MSESQITAIGQIARTVSNLEQSQQWYAQVLGLTHLYTFGNMAFFDCGGVRLMLSEADELNVDSIIYFQTNDIHACERRLIEQGVEFAQTPHKIHQHEDGSEEWMAFLNDPDSRPIGLMCRYQAGPSQ